MSSPPVLPALRPLPGAVRLHRRRTVPRVWETLAPHPAVVAQPTLAGKQLRDFTPHNGVMLMGYGDWNANTGPVDVIGYDLTTGTPVTLLTDCPTEAFDRIKVIGGQAFIPFTDPTTSANNGGFATDRSGSWRNVLMHDQSMIHCFDVIMIAGRMHLCGSNYDQSNTSLSYACVLQEQPDGSWTEVLRTASATAEVAPRFYNFFRDRYTVRVQMSGPTPRPVYMTTDGTTWTVDPDPPQLPYPPDYTPPTWPLPDGTTAYAEWAGWAWVGTDEGHVRRTKIRE